MPESGQGAGSYDPPGSSDGQDDPRMAMRRKLWDVYVQQAQASGGKLHMPEGEGTSDSPINQRHYHRDNQGGGVAAGVGSAIASHALSEEKGPHPIDPNSQEYQAAFGQGSDEGEGHQKTLGDALQEQEIARAAKQNIMAGQKGPMTGMNSNEVQGAAMKANGAFGGPPQLTPSLDQEAQQAPTMPSQSPQAAPYSNEQASQPQGNNQNALFAILQQRMKQQLQAAPYSGSGP